MVSNPGELKLWQPRYSRLYLGDEFCNWRMPSEAVLEEILEFIRGKNLVLTIVTSFCNDSEILNYNRLLEKALKSHENIELVINDWGMLEAFKGWPLKLVLGRLLVKQKRDPRIAASIGSLPIGAKKRVKGIGLNKFLLDLLSKWNIKRIELDNVLQGLDLSGLDGFNFSLHIPFVYVTLSRYCQYHTKRRAGLEFLPCINKNCPSKEIFNKAIGTPVFMRGNALFYRNYFLPEGIRDSKIDRIVYTGADQENG